MKFGIGESNCPIACDSELPSVGRVKPARSGFPRCNSEMARKCSGCAVFMLRTMFSLSAMPAHFGMSDEKCTPGIFVEMLPNGPPLGRPGLGSHVSNWLGAPQSQSRMQCFCAFFVSAAKTGL